MSEAEVYTFYAMCCEVEELLLKNTVYEYKDPNTLVNIDIFVIQRWKTMFCKPSGDESWRDYRPIVVRMLTELRGKKVIDWEVMTPKLRKLYMLWKQHPDYILEYDTKHWGLQSADIWEELAMDKRDSEDWDDIMRLANKAYKELRKL